MAKFDKKLHELSKSMEVPEEYSRRVEETLKNLPEEKILQKPKRHFSGKYIIRIAVCLIIVVVFASINANNANANIFTTFKQTIMNIFQMEGGTSPEEAGVGSKETHIGSKQDLFMELKETVVDSHTIYLLVKIIAPTSVEFSEDITFDYFAFSHGGNYNSNDLISGITSCSLLEVAEEKQNEAIYVVSISTEQEIAEGSEITVFFNDLMKEPYSDSPEMLVEGIWSLTFQADYTVTEEINIEGNSKMIYPFLGREAVVEKVEITPLGMVIQSDVSAIPYEELAISNTFLNIKLKLMDGSEVVLMSQNLEEKVMASSSISYEELDGKVYQSNLFEFDKVLNIEQILGVYIEDLFIPVRHINF